MAWSTHVAEQAEVPPIPPALNAENRDALVLKYLGDVRSIATSIWRRLPKSVQLEDLIQAGTLGLIDALSRYDPSRPLGLKQYVRIRVSGAIVDSLRELDWASRYMRTRQQKLESVTRDLESRLCRTAESGEIAEQLGMDLQSFYEFASTVEQLKPVEDSADEEDRATSIIDQLPDTAHATPDESCAEDEKRRIIHEVIAQLKPDHRKVLEMYYFEEKTMAQIAERLNLTESRISQIHSKAIHVLSRELRRVGVE